MPVLQDRVQETTTTGGTGTLTLAGAVIGYRSFNSAFTIGDITYYTIDNGAGEWEIGVGTVGSGTLSRTTVLESSNANALVNFSAGTKRVFCSAPTKVLLPNQTGNSGKVLSTDGVDPAWTTTLNGVTIGNITPAAGAFTTLSASSTVSGTGFSTYLASPPAIGGTTPAAGNFTTLGATGNVTLGDAAGDTLTINGAAVSIPNNLNFDSNTLFVDATNNRVGIRTNAPTSALDIGLQFQHYDSTTSLLTGVANAAMLKIHGPIYDEGTTGAAVITHETDGTVCIGSTRNSAGLGVLKFFTTPNSGSPTERLRIDSSGNLLLRQSSNAANTSVSFNTTAQNALTLDSSGNLGVGASAPSGFSGRVITLPKGVATPTFVTYSSGNGNSYHGIGTSSTQLDIVALGTSSSIVFYNGADGAAPTERLRIDSSGNLLLRQSSNSANTSVSFNTTVQNALTLDASGNFGVGTNSPSGGKVVIQSAAVNAGDSTALKIMQSNLSVGATVLVKMGTEVAPWSKGAIGFKRTGAYDVGAIIFCANSDAMSTADVTSSDERARIDFSGNLGLGTTSFGTSAATVLGIRTGTAPSTGPADTIQIYSTDLSAGNTMLSIFTEGTPVNANTTAAATHRIAIRINGTVYYLLANTVA